MNFSKDCLKAETLLVTGPLIIRSLFSKLLDFKFSIILTAPEISYAHIMITSMELVISLF